METQNKTAEELREENINSIVEQVEIWQKTDDSNRSAIIILNEDTSDGSTKSVNMAYGSGINLVFALKHFIQTDVGAELMYTTTKLIQMIEKDE